VKGFNSSSVKRLRGYGPIGDWFRAEEKLGNRMSRPEVPPGRRVTMLPLVNFHRHKPLPRYYSNALALANQSD
jgi:hypothetical protein